MSSSPPLREQYDRLLQSADAATEVLALLDTVGSRFDLCDMGRPVTRSLRPMLLSREAWQAASEDAAAVGRVIAELGRRFVADQRFRNATGHEDLGGAWWLRVDAGVTETRIMSRTDGVVDVDGTYRVLEHNMGFVGGGYFADHLGDLFDRTAIMSRLVAAHELVRPRFLGGLAAAIGQMPHGRQPVFGLVDEVDADLELLMQLGLDHSLIASALTKDHGATVVVGELEQLSIGDGVHLKGQRVDILMIRPDRPFQERVWHRLTAGSEGRLRSLVESGEFRFFNGVSLTHAGSLKALLALVTDEGAEPLLAGIDGSDLARARAAVPWTRRVLDGPTSWRGQEVDLLDLLARDRERFVLKPSSGAGGRGVVLGWKVPQDVWETALRSTAEVYVAQERVVPAEEPWPLRAADGSVEVVDSAASVDVFLWNDQRPASAMARLMSDGLMNISAGSSVVPTYIGG